MAEGCEEQCHFIFSIDLLQVSSCSDVVIKPILINHKVQSSLLQQALLLDCSYSNLRLGDYDVTFLDKCESPWLSFLMVHIYTDPQYQQFHSRKQNF